MAVTRSHATGAVTIFTDAQAAIWRMTSDDPGPGQKCALEARGHIAALRAKKPNVKIETRWCPSHQGTEGNEIADWWAQLAADEPAGRPRSRIVLDHEPGRFSQRENIPPATLACQRQARLL